VARVRRSFALSFCFVHLLMHLFCARSDFFNGWPQDLLQQAIEVCTDPGGEIEDCPVLELYNRDLAEVEYPEFCHKTPDYNEVRLLSRPRARRAASDAAAVLLAGRRGEPQVAPRLQPDHLDARGRSLDLMHQRALS